MKYKIQLKSKDYNLLRLLAEKNNVKLNIISVDLLCTDSDIDALCDIINDEVVENMDTSEYIPNERALELEELLDKVNHCRLI